MADVLSNEPQPQLQLPTVHQITEWSTKFQTLLKDKDGRQLFMQFLKDEHNEENLLFWTEVESLKTETTDDTDYSTKAKNIHWKYLRAHCAQEVNVTGAVRLDIERALGEEPVRKDVFDRAQHEVYTMMCRDIYPRFLLSQLFMDVVNRVCGDQE